MATVLSGHEGAQRADMPTPSRGHATRHVDEASHSGSHSYEACVIGWFKLQTPKDLLRKLERDFEKMKASPLDTDLAFNFFVTAEHMLDWSHPGNAKRQEREGLRNSDILLQVTSHLANDAKHFKAEAKHHQSVKGAALDSGLFPTGYFPTGFFAPGYFGDHLYIEFGGKAASQLGQRISVLALAEKILENWRNRIDPVPSKPS